MGSSIEKAEMAVSLPSANCCRVSAMSTASTDPHEIFQDQPLPLVAIESAWPGGSSTGWHSHSWGQLLYAIRGVMVIQAEAGTWVVPSNRALWMAAGLRHTVKMSGAVDMRTAYIDTQIFPDLPTHPCVINVSPLLRELLVEAVRVPRSQPPTARNQRLVWLIVDELRASGTVGLHLPMPGHPHLQRLCQSLIDHPSDRSGAQEWSARIGVAERTLHRLFSQETGMTFAQWREQARLLSALRDIAAGKKGIEIALNCGYSSQSAFSAMFRRHFGLSPSDFYRQISSDDPPAHSP